VDWLALIPAQVDWQTPDRPAYGFPRRFRIDASEDPEFREFTTVADLTDADVANPGVAPVALPVRGVKARYLRLTVTKFAIENGQHFFALAELMVISGRRNVALGRAVRASASSEHPPRWALTYLVDGRTPLGPPIRRELLPYDGLFSESGRDEGPARFQVDLGRVLPVQEIRLHPVHARIGADIPGFLFPERMFIEAAVDADFTNPTPLLDTRDQPLSNPGSNPVTLPVENVEARFVRISAWAIKPEAPQRFGLSEVEIYSAEENVARQGQVEDSKDAWFTSAQWPPQLLVDGYTSYGKLIELPEWLAGWNRRRELRTEIAALENARADLTLQAQRHARNLMVVAAAAFVLVTGGLIWRGRRRRAREMEALRLRLARDLHDEIGSNLAAIAVLSDLGATSAPDSAPGAREEWTEVHSIAGETMEAMREVLWVIGAREEAGFDQLARMRRVAARMFAGRKLVWRDWPEAIPSGMPMAERRQMFLFFKEAVSNAARHANASELRLALQFAARELTLEIADDGCGFNPAASPNGVGIPSLQERARRLRGQVRITSTPGGGTTVSLHGRGRTLARSVTFPYLASHAGALDHRRQRCLSRGGGAGAQCPGGFLRGAWIRAVRRCAPPAAGWRKAGGDPARYRAAGNGWDQRDPGDEGRRAGADHSRAHGLRGRRQDLPRHLRRRFGLFAQIRADAARGRCGEGGPDRRLAHESTRREACARDVFPTSAAAEGLRAQ
jgi:signal transduction histidine kinase